MKEKIDEYLSLAEGELLPCGIFIDEEGDWHYRGSRMQRSDIVAYLCRHVRRDEASSSYVIEMGRQRCYLEVEDTPLVITRVLEQQDREGRGLEEFLVVVKFLQVHEPLNPADLWVGKGNVLYCRVGEHRLPARFLRPAYYQLARFIKQDDTQDAFYLSLKGERFYIRQAARNLSQ
jgi:hypothetical protein